MAHRRIWFNLIALTLIAWIPWNPAGFRMSGVSLAQGSGGIVKSFQEPALEPQVRFAEHQDESPSLVELGRLWQKAGGEGDAPLGVQPRLTFPKVERSPQVGEAPLDPLLQLQESALLESAPIGTVQMPPPLVNFDGLNNLNSVLPPDPNGDIGPEHYVQWVNLSMAVWRIDRAAGTAVRILGPQSGSALWAGFGGPCETRNDGDPIALYDHLADRWFMSQFAVNGPYYQCIAVSRSGDPTGSWYRYAFKISDTKMNDYPHFGVWRDGYYMTANQFTGNSYAGALVVAFEREKMLAGLPARMVSFDLFAVNADFSGMLPSDLDGQPPPPGTPNYILEADDSSWIGPADALRIWEFHVDWSDPQRSRLGQAGSPDFILPIADFTPLCPKNKNCIPQPGSLARLDAVADRLMHRVQYRDFGSYAALVSNFTVDAGGRAGIRWFELRGLGGVWSLHQQGTYAGQGSDADHRWMASAAMDKVGNLALGFSISGSSRYPSIHYAGRMAGDPPGLLSQGEGILVAGGGAQTSNTGRWGDYSMLAVDPVDDCTFWYTSEYYPFSSSFAWQTRIGAFALPSCQAVETGKLQGRVTDAAGQPLAGAFVRANGMLTQTDSNGIYQFFNLPVGAFSVTASLYGYGQAEVEVEIPLNQTVSQDLSLEILNKVLVKGTVVDGSGQGWSLYAHMQIDAPDWSQTIHTDPFTGAYQVELAEGIPHTFTVSAVLPGYTPAAAAITPTSEAPVQDFSIAVDAAACLAPGYDAAQGCSPLAGGLLAGNVYDANTGEGINGATVADEAAASGVDTLATPQDPQVADGFYTLFSPRTGSILFTAREDNYGSQVREGIIVPGSVTRLDFTLPAGRLTADREALYTRLSNLRGSSDSIVLTNSGTYTATYSLVEVDAPSQGSGPSGSFAAPTRRTSPKHLHDLNASYVYEYSPPQAAALNAGELLGSWPAGQAAPWGLGFDAFTGVLWVGSTKAGGGADQVYPFSPLGGEGGIALDLVAQGAVFPADMAFDPSTGNLWQVWAGGSNCLVQIDPEGAGLTGRTLCPGFDNSQRGLAYNPLDRTFYSGAWTNGTLYHFDASGVLLDSVSTGLNISGLAFNPSTRHLFVLTNADRGFDVYVLDTSHNYALVGGFDIPGLEAYQQAGLELDCDGYLWAVNQVSGQIIKANSGETSPCAWNDITWLRASPTSGSLSPGESQTIWVTIAPHAEVFSAGETHLVIYSGTPYGPVVIPVHPDPVYEAILPYIFKR